MELKEYEVKISIMTEGEFFDTIEASSEQEAEQIATDRIWADEYTRELRACSSIVNEEYEAYELCPECERLECICEEEYNEDFIE